MGLPSRPEGGAGRGGADYHGRALRGVSFRGRDLDGADFREADLRGADFTGASLRSADFSGAQLGVRPHIGLMILLVAAVAGTLAAAGSVIAADESRERIQSPEWEVLASGVWTGPSCSASSLFCIGGVQEARCFFCQLESLSACSLAS